MKATDIVAVTPDPSDTTKIEVVCTRSVPRIFAVFLSDKDTDVSARAVAQKKSQ